MFNLKRKRTPDKRELCRRIFIDFANALEAANSVRRHYMESDKIILVRKFPAQTRARSQMIIHTLEAFISKDEVMDSADLMVLQTPRLVVMSQLFQVWKDEMSYEAFLKINPEWQEFLDMGNKLYAKYLVLEKAVDDRYLEIHRKKQAKRSAKLAKPNLRERFPEIESFLSWLQAHGQDPDLWHIVVTQTDPDGKEKLYDWIARQPDCDKGTAIQIFHHCAGYEALGYPDPDSLIGDSREDMYRTAKLVADRINSNAFKTWRFSHNDDGCFGSLEDHIVQEKKTIEKYGQALFSLSTDLFDANEREEPVSEYNYSDF